MQAASILDFHEAPVRLVKFNQALDLAVSADQSGILEIWDPETQNFPEDGRL